MLKTWTGLSFVTLIAGFSGSLSEARAQLPGEAVVVENVVPQPPTVSYGERTTVRYRRNKTVIRERPVTYVRPSAPVVQTRVIRSSPVVEGTVISTPAPIIQDAVVDGPAPIVESTVVRSAPIVDTQVIRTSPLVETRYYRPYPVLRPRYYVPYP